MIVDAKIIAVTAMYSGLNSFSTLSVTVFSTGMNPAEPLKTAFIVYLPGCSIWVAIFVVPDESVMPSPIAAPPSE